jgi:hypothetical protein
MNSKRKNRGFARASLIVGPQHPQGVGDSPLQAKVKIGGLNARRPGQWRIAPHFN